MATLLHDADWVQATLNRLAHEILEDPAPGTDKALIGLRTRGAILADRLGLILSGTGHPLPVGYLDTTMYRDDLHTGAGLKPIQPSEINFDLNDKTVILIDDVVCTGRTIRAAIDALFDYGRPAAIRLCCMLDRGERELPIQPDFTGEKVQVAKGGFVRLKLKGTDPQDDAVFLVGPGEEEPK